MQTPIARIALAILLFVSCGKGGNTKNVKRDAAPPPVAAPIALPALGVDKITRFSFIYDAGSPAYTKAKEAAKKSDWAEVRKQTEAALAKDPNHLDAVRGLEATGHAAVGPLLLRLLPRLARVARVDLGRRGWFGARGVAREREHEQNQTGGPQHVPSIR